MVAKVSIILTLVFASTAFSGCVEGEGDVAIYVKDAPTDEFENVYITFSEVRVHGGDNDKTDDNDTNDNDTAGWVTVFEGSSEIDLLAYSEADQKAFLGEEGLAAGHYNQIVITVDSARGVLVDGNETDIRVITGQLRVTRAFDISAGETTQIVIDIDLDRSLVEQGPRGWALTPVVGSVTVTEDASAGNETA